MRKLLPWMVVVLGCSNDSPAPEERYVAKLRDCGVLGEQGQFNFNFAGFSREDSCALECALEASCGEVAALACEGPDWPKGALGRCFEKCYPDAERPVACADGSSDEAYRCDGEEDCEDGADESDCPASAFFACQDGEKLPKDYRCDGEDDCAEGEDERGCSEAERGVGFTCADGSFVRGIGIECDGSAECADGSDETRCLERGKAFDCGGGTIVALEDVCNGNRDCADGSDERQDCAVLQCMR